MPVFAVKSEGVSFAMSFICELSTMATLIEPPFVPDAGVPPPLELLLDLLEPPQPTATVPTTASTASADPRPIVRLISSPLGDRRADRSLRTWATYNVGLCWL